MTEMKKFIVKLKFVLFFCISLFASVPDGFSQCKFRIGNGDDVDTVCLNDTVRILDFTGGACGTIAGGTKHRWSYISASITNLPIVDNAIQPKIDSLRQSVIVIDSGHYFIFATKSLGNPRVVRFDFTDSLSHTPVSKVICDLSAYTDSIRGISVQYDVDSSRWIMLVTAGEDHEDDASKNRGRIIRVTLGNSLLNNPVKIEDLGSYSGSFTYPSKIVLSNYKGHWYGFVANSKGLIPAMTVLDFTKGLAGDSASILVTRYNLDKNLFNSSTKGIAGLAPLNVRGTWHVFCVNQDVDNYIFRIDFDSVFFNYTTTKIKDLNKTITSARDISVVNDCSRLMGVVINGSKNTYSLLSFDSTVTGTIKTIKSASDPVKLISPMGITDFQRVQSNLYAFITNKIGSFTRIRFNPDGVVRTSPVNPVDNNFAPAHYTYTDTGYFTVTLTINDDFEKTTCRTVYVMKKPDKPSIIDSGYFCHGDTIMLDSAYSSKAQYNWTLPSGTTINRYPTFKDPGMGEYKNNISYDMCFSETDSKNIFVHMRPLGPEGSPIITICPGNTTQIKVQRLKLYDSVFVYHDTLTDTTIFRRLYDTLGSSMYYTSRPEDITDSTYTYFVSRKPKFTNCPIKTSDSLMQELRVKFPDPPLVDGPHYICKTENTVVVKALNGKNIKWYADSLMTTLLTPEPISYYSPKPSELITMYNKFWATQFDGCESSVSKPAIVVVSNLYPPNVPSIHGCVGQGFDPAFVAIGTSGTVKWYADNLLNVQIDEGVSHVHGIPQDQTGSDTVWVTQTIIDFSGEECESAPMLASINVYHTDPPELLFNPNYFSCTVVPPTKKLNELRIKPVDNFEKIEWYQNNDLVNIVGKTANFTPNVSKTDSSSNTFRVRQMKNGCFSDFVYSRYTVLKCQPYQQALCNTMDTFNLYQAIPAFKKRPSVWEDIEYTGRLRDSVLFDISNMTNETHYFQDSNKIVKVIIDQRKIAGTIAETPVIVCSNPYNLFDALNSEDPDGYWYDETMTLVKKPVITVKPMRHAYYYKIYSANGGCPMDSMYVPLLADTALTVDCVKEKNIYLDENVETWLVTDNSLDPQILNQPSCSNYTLTYQLDSVQVDKNSLYNTTLVEGHHTVIWIGKNIFTNTPVACTSMVNVTPIMITNLYTPNNDGVNDTWEIDLRKYPTSVVKVFNRWGAVVFEQKAAEAAGNRIVWDGLIQGKGLQAPSDGYFYLVVDGDKIISKGSVTLVR